MKQIPSRRFAIEKTDHDAPLGTAVVGKRKVPLEFTNQVQHRTKVLRWKKGVMNS